MATNTSEHLGLHLWEPTDQVLRTEFNQNWTKLDEAVEAAQSTADTAETKADAAQTAASTKPYVVGTYTGNGGTVTVTLGWKPSFLIISGETSNTSSSISSLGSYTVITCGNSQSGSITLTATGFTAQVLSNNYVPKMSVSGRKYDYIAFR